MEFLNNLFTPSRSDVRTETSSPTQENAASQSAKFASLLHEDDEAIDEVAVETLHSFPSYESEDHPDFTASRSVPPDEAEEASHADAAGRTSLHMNSEEFRAGDAAFAPHSTLTDDTLAACVDKFHETDAARNAPGVSVQSQLTKALSEIKDLLGDNVDWNKTEIDHSTFAESDVKQLPGGKGSRIECTYTIRVAVTIDGQEKMIPFEMKREVYTTAKDPKDVVKIADQYAKAITGMGLAKSELTSKVGFSKLQFSGERETTLNKLASQNFLVFEFDRDSTGSISRFNSLHTGKSSSGEETYSLFFADEVHEEIADRAVESGTKSEVHEHATVGYNHKRAESHAPVHARERSGSTDSQEPVEARVRSVSEESNDSMVSPGPVKARGSRFETVDLGETEHPAETEVQGKHTRSPSTESDTGFAVRERSVSSESTEPLIDAEEPVAPERPGAFSIEEGPVDLVLDTSHLEAPAPITAKHKITFAELKAKAKIVGAKISSLTLGKNAPKSISRFSLANAILLNRDAMAAVDKKPWGAVRSFTAKLFLQLASRGINIPIAVVYECVSGVLKCIKKVPSDIVQAAKLGKIELLTNIDKINNREKAGRLTKIGLIALQCIKALGMVIARSVGSVVSGSLMSVATAVQISLKGGVLMLMSTSDALGKRGTEKAGSRTQDAMEGIRKGFVKIQQFLETGFSKKLEKAEIERAIIKATKLRDIAQEELNTAEAKARDYDTVKAEIDEYMKNTGKNANITAVGDIITPANKDREAVFEAQKKLIEAKEELESATAKLKDPKIYEHAQAEVQRKAVKEAALKKAETDFNDYIAKHKAEYDEINKKFQKEKQEEQLRKDKVRFG